MGEGISFLFFLLSGFWADLSRVVLLPEVEAFG